jgi:hypothetical protein
MSYSAHGNREHCIPITTARQKNQRFSAIEGHMDVRRHYIQHFGISLHVAKHCAGRRTMLCMQNFFDSMKMRMTQGFLAIRMLCRSNKTNYLQLADTRMKAVQTIR